MRRFLRLRLDAATAAFSTEKMYKKTYRYGDYETYNEIARNIIVSLAKSTLAGNHGLAWRP
jgi:hypothetical protein